MKKITCFLGLGLAGVVALLLPLNANAKCDNGLTFGNDYYVAVTNTSNGPSLRSNFWTLDSGNASTGSGHDNGTVVETGNWLKLGYGGALRISGDWENNTGYNGCPDTAQPDTSLQRMVFSLSDVDGLGNPTYAVACVARTPATSPQFDLLNALGGVPGNLALVLAPQAKYSSTLRLAPEVQVTVEAPNFSAGLYSDGSPGCGLAGAIPQYDVYKQQIVRNTTKDPSTDVTSSWVLVGTGVSGAPFVFTTNCNTTPPNGNCDVYVATTPHYNSNFGTSEAATGSPIRLGPSSSKLHSGPTLAEPPKVKVIKNLKGGVQQKQ